jgi:glycosyltransferase involved in cell wall biosynthesis
VDQRSDRPRIGFVLERSLGHSTHAANLARVLPTIPSIRAELRQVAYAVEGPAARVPVYKSNWTVRAGVRAGRAIRQMRAEGPLDALFIHTQVPAVLSQPWMAKVPTVVSLDATPIQYDELGSHYDHHPGHGRVEALKYRANRRCLHRAVHVVTWSEWAKRGVVDGYGVAPELVTVIPPGVTPSLWYRPVADVDEEQRSVRILFVGGDLQRKGGDVLLQAFAALRQQVHGATRAPDVELHLVTGTAVEPLAGVHVHHGLRPNSPELIALYHEADIFCLPTRGDCLPMVLSEAGAAGLPSVTTAVAAIPEVVRDGETGLIVPVDDRAALTSALRLLVDDPGRRRRFGAAAQRLVTAEFDADRNARRLVDVLLATAVRWPARSGGA